MHNSEEEEIRSIPGENRFWFKLAQDNKVYNLFLFDVAGAFV